MKTSAKIVTAFILLVFLDARNGGALPASDLYSEWSGQYIYREGEELADAIMSVEYTLRISHGKKDACTLTAIGYQSDDHILCAIDGNRQKIDIKFVSYESGKILNQYGVLEYKPDQTLFELKRDGNSLGTTWRALATNIVQSRNMSSSYFKKMK